MDARREPRFSIYGPVKVTLLSSPEHVLDCVLAGYLRDRSQINRTRKPGLSTRLLSIEAEDHLALADTPVLTAPRR